MNEAPTLSRAPTLGDVGPHDDVSYTGADPSNAFTLDYYREKAREFQSLLNSLDATYEAVATLIDSGTTSEALFMDLWAAMDEFAARKTALKLTAEAINAGASIVNALGGRFPQLSIPATLGLGPIVIPAATIAAIGTAATLAAWGVMWIQGVNERLKREQLLQAQSTPAQAAALAAAIASTDGAIAQADSSIWSQAGAALKWVVLGVAGFFAWKLLQGSDSRD